MKKKDGFQLEGFEAVVSWAEGHPLGPRPGSPGLVATLSLDAPADLVFRFGSYSDLPMADQIALLREFGDLVLLDWNMTDANGEPVEPTGEGMLKQPMRLMTGIMSKWVEELTGNPTERQSADITGLEAPSVKTGT